MTIPSNEPSSVTAQLIHFKAPADGSKPYTDINVDIRNEEEGRNWTKEVHNDVQIENLRGKEDSVTLDGNGFQFFKGRSTHQAFANEDEVKREYYPESIELVKKITGASRVVPFDHSGYSKSWKS